MSYDQRLYLHESTLNLNSEVDGFIHTKQLLNLLCTVYVLVKEMRKLRTRYICDHRRFRLHILVGSLWEAKAPRVLQMEHLDSGQTVRIRTLISIFAERTCQLVHYTLGWIPVIDLLITHSCLEA